jgi:beta-ureidopropionase / N-carbamoyl-L-amino-acid hydrolase
MGPASAELSRADPARVVASLEHLRSLTGTDAGAQRVAWTPIWARARAWLREELERLPVTVDVDEAGNIWATLAGREARSVVIGSHLDSVPDGGWLDGCLGVLAGLEVLRAAACGAARELGVTLVDWADEEGARFGHSLFGSSAAAGLLDVESLRELVDGDDVGLPDALAAHGVVLDEAPRASVRLRDVAAYVELHIEQGPVLEEAGLALGAVERVFGIERHRVQFDGRASHAGSTPMRLRHDALAAAARLVLAARESAVERGGVATIGELRVAPGIPTAIPDTARLILDQRHGDPDALEAMLADVREAADAIASDEGVAVSWTPIQSVAPVRFDERLIEAADESVRSVVGEGIRLASGALHDAVMVARAGIPTVMLFVQSAGGISHSRLEDSRREHIEQGVAALDVLVRRLLDGEARS